MKAAPLATLIALGYAYGSGAAASAEVPTKPAEPQPHGAEIEPRAAEVLHGMASYLSGLQNFQVQSEAVDEVVLNGGGKVQSITTSRVTVHRPNEFRSEQVGPGANLIGWYDGKNLTVYCKTNNTYGAVPAPPTIDAALDMARNEYGVEAPASDLVYKDPYAVLTENAKSGKYLGMEDVGGIPAHHLAFQEDEVDWQLWVQDGPKPLPLRYVITTKTLPSQPQFTANLSAWDTRATPSADAFNSRPPAGAKHVNGLPTSCPAVKR